MVAQAQRRMLLGLAENLPSIGFLSLMQLEAGLRIAGWTGTLLSALVLGLFAAGRIRPHPILIGINIFMLCVTPSIELLHAAGQHALAGTLTANVQIGVLLTVFASGLIQTLVRKGGFLGLPDAAPDRIRRNSALLLAISAAGILWSAQLGSDRLIGIALPLAFLFGTRQYLLARVHDKTNGQDDTTAGSLSILPVGEAGLDPDLTA